MSTTNNLLLREVRACPHHAKTTTRVDPSKVDPERYGHHRSAVAVGVNESIRHWAFEDETGRDLFIMEHAAEVRR